MTHGTDRPSTAPTRPGPARARLGQALGGWLAVGGLLALGLLTTALGSPTSEVRAASASQTTSAADTVAGQTLYQTSCASCHGDQGRGTANGPSLRGVGAAASDFYLRTGRMPLSAPGQPVIRHSPRFTDEEIRALNSLVASFGAGPTIPQVTGGGDVGRGNELYVANCAACHGASGAGNAIGGGNDAANLGRATAVQVVEAMRIGPGVMPQFDLDPADEEAIASYVTWLQSAPNPGGLTLGGFGPVPEGFVAVAIGLLLMVLAARFVGRPGHEGQPEEADA